MQKLSPSKEELSRRGCGEDIQAIWATLFNSIQEQEAKQEYGNELLTIVQNYLSASLEIPGGITLLSKAVEDAIYYKVGCVESDWITINKQTGEIELVEYQSEQPLIKLALNDQHFLDVIYRIFQHYCDTRLREKKEDRCAVAKELWHLSGEPSSLMWYKGVVGCDS